MPLPVSFKKTFNHVKRHLVKKKVRGIPLIFKLRYETPRFKLWFFIP